GEGAEHDISPLVQSKDRTSADRAKVSGVAEAELFREEFGKILSSRIMAGSCGRVERCRAS
ncbi:MAG: hypothetical protein AAGE03_13900, partial [Pseudomonadota bacterium]